MLRKTLTLGMVFILALSLLAVSMITCFTYDANAHDVWGWKVVFEQCFGNVCIKIWAWGLIDHFHTG